MQIGCHPLANSGPMFESSCIQLALELIVCRWRLDSVSFNSGHKNFQVKLPYIFTKVPHNEVSNYCRAKVLSLPKGRMRHMQKTVTEMVTDCLRMIKMSIFA